MKSNLDHIKELVKKSLADEEGLLVVILYGSQAAGCAHSGSDVDLAVLYDKPLTFDHRCELMGRLEKALKAEVDLVDLYSLHGVILKQILTKGRVLYGKGSPAYEGLLTRMVYNQEDMMPYFHRSLKDRRTRFVNG
jgi:predicted nucleotidyltransferase